MVAKGPGVGALGKSQTLGSIFKMRDWYLLTDNNKNKPDEPSSGNRRELFIETGGLSDVVLNWYGEAVEKLEPYAKAYHSAAQLLIEKSTGDQLRDINACPVVFLYRLSLELYLKAILILGSSIFG